LNEPNYQAAIEALEAISLNEDAMLKTLKFWYTIWTDSDLLP